MPQGGSAAALSMRILHHVVEGLQARPRSLAPAVLLLAAWVSSTDPLPVLHVVYGLADVPGDLGYRVELDLALSEDDSTPEGLDHYARAEADDIIGELAASPVDDLGTAEPLGTRQVVWWGAVPPPGAASS